MCIWEIDTSMFHKTKKNQNILLQKSYKNVCLRINGAQSVILEKWTIEFKSFFKQVTVPFKTYADFECNLDSVESYEGS